MREAESRDAVRVRDATIADLPVVMVIENDSFSDPWSEQAYRETLEAEPPFVYGIEQQRQRQPNRMDL